MDKRSIRSLLWSRASRNWQYVPRSHGAHIISALCELHHTLSKVVFENRSGN